ncbi:hypothetical protein C0Q70_08212 [Pomacea canaliculata]|uniref:Uncharacterized protein n=1 Tax=Pomacea canaliculata TaxID=400727 RepID=A0A2T7PH70_POMCA|nr:hypothetical protein C0Q70_08212 [Pomacea canaliculata]
MCIRETDSQAISTGLERTSHTYRERERRRRQGRGLARLPEEPPRKIFKVSWMRSSGGGCHLLVTRRKPRPSNTPPHPIHPFPYKRINVVIALVEALGRCVSGTLPAGGTRRARGPSAGRRLTC